jgi:hypothetical protein
MKISIRKSKRSTSIVFKAESSRDGVELKNAVLSALHDRTVGGFTPARVVEQLENAGYGLEKVNGHAVTPDTAALELRCAEWNAKHRVGTKVEYHPVIGEKDHRLTRTRSAAYVLSGHTAVLFVESESGCVALDACVPVVKK